MSKRKKVNLAYITNKTVRKRTLKRRKKGFLKKLDELKILCGVDACAVIYSPHNSETEALPSNSEVHRVIEKLELLPEEKQTKRSVNHEEFLIQAITKVQNQVERMAESNNDKLMEEVMFYCLNGNMGDLVIDDFNRGKLYEFIDGYLKQLYHQRNVILQNSHLETGEPYSMAMAMDMPPTAMNVPTSNDVQSTIPTNQGLEQVPSLGNNFMSVPIFNPPQPINEMHQPVITSNQGSDHVDPLASNLFPSSNHGVNTQFMNQDEVFYPLNQQDWYDEKMMKLSEPTCFPWMDKKHHYNHRQF